VLNKKAFSQRLWKVALAAATTVLLAAAPFANANEIVALKHALYGAGYSIDNVSPQMDSNTRAELTRFQRDQGLEASGVLDQSTEQALGMGAVQQASVASQPEPDTSQAPGSQESASSPAASEPEEKAVEEDDDDGWSLW